MLLCYLRNDWFANIIKYTHSMFIKTRKAKLYASALSKILFGNTALVHNYIVWMEGKCLFFLKWVKCSNTGT